MLADASPWLTRGEHNSAYMPNLTHFSFPSSVRTKREKFLFVHDPHLPFIDID
jgi:hypothetical protein